MGIPHQIKTRHYLLMDSFDCTPVHTFLHPTVTFTYEILTNAQLQQEADKHADRKEAVGYGKSRFSI